MKIFNKKIEEKKLNIKKNKDTYIKRLSISLSCLILLFIVVLFTFAKFETSSEEYTLINGKILDASSADVTLSYVIDGVSQSAPPAKNAGYIIKEVNCTNATGTWDTNRWGLYVDDITGKAKCNLEFELVTSINVTMYGAANAVIRYTDSTGTHTQTLDSTGKKTNVELGYLSEITFEDTTVAKDPNNQSNNYTKTINLSPTTTEIYVMPDGDVLYWYGYNPSKLQVMKSANGWTQWSSYPAVDPTFYANYINIQSSGNRGCGVGSISTYDNSTYSKLRVIGKGIQNDSSLGYNIYIGLNPSKSFLQGTGPISTIGIYNITRNLTSTRSYIFMNTIVNMQSQIYAVYLEA